MKGKSAGKTFVRISQLQKGLSTLEVLIAMAIMVTTMAVLILVVSSNQTVTVSSYNNSTAAAFVSRMIEKAKAQSEGDFNNLVSSSSLENIFKKKLNVTDVNPCQKNITASVSWSDSLETPQNITDGSVVGNISEAVALAGDCGPEAPKTDWQTITCDDIGATFDFSPSGIPATGIDLVARGGNKYTIISANGNSAGQDDLWVVNVNNRAVMQTKVSSLNVGAGLNDIDAAGNFAFVANNATSKQLIVVNLTDLYNPSIVASVSLNGAFLNNSEAQKIFYFNKRVYIGTYYTGFGGRDEFQVFNVANPANPIFMGSYNVNHSIYAILIRDEVVAGTLRTVAYLALSATDAAYPELIALDVTNPAAITQIGSGFNAPGYNQYGTAIYALSNQFYFGRQRGTGTNYDLFSLNVSNPNAISELDHELLNLNPNKEVRGIIVSGPLMFLSTSDSNKEGFQVWNVSNLADIKPIAKCNYPQEAMDIDFDGNYIYVANRSQKALRIIYDSTNPFP